MFDLSRPLHHRTPLVEPLPNFRELRPPPSEASPLFGVCDLLGQCDEAEPSWVARSFLRETAGKGEGWGGGLGKGGRRVSGLCLGFEFCWVLGLRFGGFGLVGFVFEVLHGLLLTVKD